MGGQVICTSVVPWLSTGLATNNKIMFMYILFSWLFDHFEGLAFFENVGGGKLSTKAVKQDAFSKVFKDKTIK